MILSFCANIVLFPYLNSAKSKLSEPSGSATNILTFNCNGFFAVIDRMLRPSWSNYTAGSRTTTRTIHTKVYECNLLVSSSVVFNPQPVRLHRGNSRMPFILFSATNGIVYW